MKQAEFTEEEISSCAKSNAGALWLATLSFLKSKGADVDEWIAYIGKQYAPGWEFSDEMDVLEVTRDAVKNWISCGAELVTISGDEKYGEAVLEWPSEEDAVYFDVSISDAQRVNNLFGPIATHLGLNFSWESLGDRFKLIFSK